MAKTINKSAAYPKDSGRLSPATLSDRPDDYPTIRLESHDDPELPDEGELTIKFHKTHEEVRNKDKPNEVYACTLEVLHLVKVKGSKGKPAESHDESGSALDKLMQEKEEAAEGEA
jgi:hypothetical protein